MDQKKQAGRGFVAVKDQQKMDRIFSRLQRLQALRSAAENTPAGAVMELPEVALEEPERWDGMS